MGDNLIMEKNQYNTVLSKMDTTEILGYYTDLVDLNNLTSETRTEIEAVEHKFQESSDYLNQLKDYNYETVESITNLENKIAEITKLKKSLGLLHFSKRKAYANELKSLNRSLLDLKVRQSDIDTTTLNYSIKCERLLNRKHMLLMNYDAKQMVLNTKLHNFRRRANKIVQYVNSKSSDKININTLIDFLQDKIDGKISEIIESSFEENESHE